MENSISKNTIFNVINKGVQVLFPLLTVSYISRVLGASGIGEVSSAQNLTQYFTMAAALGIPSYGVRAISQTKKFPQLSSKTFSELFVINAISTMLCFLLYFFVLVIPSNNYNKTLGMIFSSIVFLNFANVEWVYQGFEEYKYITLRSILVKTISLILLFVFVRERSDVIWYAAIVCFGTAGNYLLNLVNLKKYVKFSWKGLSLRTHFLPVTVFFASVVAIEIYSLLDITMLTAFTNKISVGYYTNAVNIVKMIAGVLTSFAAVLMPRFSVYFAEKKYIEIKKVGRKFLGVTIALGIPAFAGLSLLADQIVKVLFGAEFAPVALTIRLLAPLIVLMPLSGGVFCQLLQTSGKERSYFICVLSGAVVNAVLNYLMIPNMAYNGAAIASVLSELTVTSSMILLSRKVVKVGLSVKNFLSTVLSSIGMIICVCVIKELFSTFCPVVLLGIEVVWGMMVYFALLLLMKNDTVIEFRNRILQKKKPIENR